MRSPPFIRHIGRRCRREQKEKLIDECAERVHLTDRGRRLLAFYGSCRSGFCPARKLIHKATGINPQDIYGYKKELHDLGLILTSESGHSITVDWERIRLYTTLDPRMTSRYRNHTVVSYGSRFLWRKDNKIKYGFKKEPSRREMTPAQSRFYQVIGEMTESEWNFLLSLAGVQIPRVTVEETDETMFDWEDWDYCWYAPCDEDEIRTQIEENKVLPF